MIEFIKLMGLNRILFLAGLILYVIIIFIALCSDSSSQGHTVTADSSKNADDEDEDLLPDDAPYTVQSSLSESKSPGILRKIFRKKPKDDDFWYL